METNSVLYILLTIALRYLWCCMRKKTCAPVAHAPSRWDGARADWAREVAARDAADAAAASSALVNNPTDNPVNNPVNEAARSSVRIPFNDSSSLPTQSRPYEVVSGQTVFFFTNHVDAINKARRLSGRVVLRRNGKKVGEAWTENRIREWYVSLPNCVLAGQGE
ncbi:MAG: hypothetical protein PHV11_00355 [Candidatus Bipolaricaulis sp.]|nr:hypothetical protein [Candidatus Bipolaricaulis sp.]